MTTQPDPRQFAPSRSQPEEPSTEGPLDVRTGLLLLAGGGATYVAFQHPGFGTALLVGVAVMTLLHILLSRR